MEDDDLDASHGRGVYVATDEGGQPIAAQRVRVFVGLGGNQGDARGVLAAAVGALGALPGVVVRAVSSLYRTRPVGVLDQPDFLNAVVELEAPGGVDPAQGALALLAALKGIERAFGRGPGPHWGPRPLDLDLLLFGPHVVHVERPAVTRSDDPARALQAQWLDVPHASARHRLFVLAPLAELAPDLTPPGWDETVVRARARQADAEGPGSVRCVGRWDAGARRWASASEVDP